MGMEYRDAKFKFKLGLALGFSNYLWAGAKFFPNSQIRGGHIGPISRFKPTLDQGEVKSSVIVKFSNNLQ